MDHDKLIKMICYGAAIALAYHLLVWLFPYVVASLATLGVGYLFLEYQKHNRRR